MASESRSLASFKTIIIIIIKTNFSFLIADIYLRNEEEKNEILQLYERMRKENEDRKKECEKLKDLLYQVN